MKKILIFLCFIVLSTITFSQTFKITEYRNSKQFNFSKTSGTLVFNEKEIKIFNPEGTLIMDFKISSIDDSNSNEVFCDGIDVILDEYLVIKITYHKINNTFNWTIIYLDGYAIFKTKRI